MRIPYVIDIQRYCIHDGGGIRSTVFFKGCPLRCSWCHNPESQRFGRELLFHRERCAGCGACAEACLTGAARPSDGSGPAEMDWKRCAACGACADGCQSGARELVGREMPAAELAGALARDQAFYEQSGGGVTLSGGEAAAQDPDYIESLMRLLRRRGIGVNIDTCGHVPPENLLRLLPLTDTFLYDLKLMDSALHRRWTGEGNERILQNFIELARRGARLNVRVPVIGGVNAKAGAMREIAAFVRENAPAARVNLLPYHDTGSGKYQKLGRGYDGNFFRPDDGTMGALRGVFTEYGFAEVRIGG